MPVTIKLEGGSSWGREIVVPELLKDFRLPLPNSDEYEIYKYTGSRDTNIVTGYVSRYYYKFYKRERI